MRTAAVLAGLLALSGCVSSTAASRAWIQEHQAEAEGYPSLHDVPRTTIANTDARHWARVERDLLRAREQLLSNPRAEPAPPQNSDEFITQAREELEESRQAHPD